MRKTLLATVALAAILLAGCTTTSQLPPITFSSVVVAAQKACGFVISATSIPVINTIIAANPALNTADLIGVAVCSAIASIPASTKEKMIAGTEQPVTVVINGQTYVVQGHF